MPHKRRGHGHHKQPKDAEEHGGAATPPEVHSRFSTSQPTAGSSYGKSQSSQATPKPAAQVSSVKPALFENASSGSGMAAKPRVLTATSSGVTQSGVAAGGCASVGKAGKSQPETNTTPPGATVIDMSSAGATFVDMTSAGQRGSPKEVSKTAAVSQVKASTTVPSAASGLAATAAVTKPKESPKGTDKVDPTATGVSDSL